MEIPASASFQKVQNCAVSMLEVSHRPYALMCHRAKLELWIVGPFPQPRLGCFYLKKPNPLRLHGRKDFRVVVVKQLPRACTNSGADWKAFCHLVRRLDDDCQ
jgi:hypothetical protein